MIVRRTPVAIAVSLAMGATLPALAAEYEGEDYGHVPNYQYINLDQWSHHREEGEEQHCTGDCFTVDASQGPITDPLFLLVGQQRDGHYARQNPEYIVTQDRDAVEVMGGEWNSAIIVNTSTISTSGMVKEPDYDSVGAIAISIDSTRVTGLSKSDRDAGNLSELPVFSNGDSRVVIFNAGTVSSEHNAIVFVGENYEGDDFPAYVNGSIINHASTNDGHTGIISAQESYAIALAYARLDGNIINGLDSDAGTARISGGEHAIYLFDDSIMHGNIVNRGLMEAYEGSVIRIEDSELRGAIVNTGTIRTGSGEAAIRIQDTTGDIFIDQRGTLLGLRQEAITESLGTAMLLDGQNIRVRLSDGQVRGDTSFSGSHVTFAGGTYEGTITNQGGTFVVEGLQRIDGAYQQDDAATLELSSHQVSRLSANRITLADGSTLVIGNGEAYRDFVDGRQVIALEADDLELDLTALNLQPGTGLLRVTDHKLSEDGTQLLVSYSGLNGDQLAQDAIQRSRATGTKARQLQGLGRALDNVLLINDQAAQVIGQNIERLEELLPDSSGAISSATATATQAGAGAVSTRARGVAAGDLLAGQGIWVKGIYGEVSQRQRDGIEGFDSDTQGFVLGGDAELSNGTVIGLAWAHTNTDVTGKNGLTNSDVDFDQLSAYTSRTYGNWLFDAQISYGIGTNETSRQVMGSNARANFDSSQVGAQVAASYEWQLDATTRLTPRASLNYANLELDAYEESGAGALNLRNEEQRIERFELGLEGELSHLTQVGGLMVEPRLTLGAYHDFQGKARSSISSFAFAPEETRFVAEGPEADKTRYNAGIGVDLYGSGGFTTSLDYGYGWASSMSSHAGSLQVRYDF